MSLTPNPEALPGTCILCNKPLGKEPGQCDPGKRCYEKEGRSEYSVSLECAEKGGAMRVEMEYRSKLAPLLTAVLNFETAPDEYKGQSREIVLKEVADLFKDDPEANRLRAWFASASKARTASEDPGFPGRKVEP